MAQFIQTGPVVGGVTDQSARIYIQANNHREVTVELSDSENFTNLISFTDTTSFALDTAIIFELNGLQPATKYYYRFQSGQFTSPITGSFSTFPPPGQSGNYKIVVGSCDYQYNQQLFEQVEAYGADVFLHLGDWLWPPSHVGNNFNLSPELRAEAYQYRFHDENFTGHVFLNTPVDFVYDDDMAVNDCEGWTVPNEYFVDSNGVIYNFVTYDSLPQGTREGAIAGYFTHFPGYPSVDTTQGIYHSFQLGNIDIFMTDGRSSRQPRAEAFHYNAADNLWSYEPDSNHTMLGVPQREWLVNGLRNSTADWKLVGTGVVFNQQYQRILNIGLTSFAQEATFSFGPQFGTGVTLAASMAYNWTGFPADSEPLLNLKNEGVHDVIMMSGDSHSCVLDDGTNAGLPEINSSGMAAGDEGSLNYFIDSVGQSLGQPPVIDSLWNGGGNGVGNTNFNDAFGTIETYGSDSLKMCVIDEFGQTLGCITLLHSSIAGVHDSRFYSNPAIIQVIYPNPAKDILEIQLRSGYQPSTGDRCIITDITGKIIRELDIQAFSGQRQRISLGSFAAGAYQITYAGKEEKHSLKFVVSK